MSTTAKAYIGAILAALTAFAASDDLDARAIITAAIAGLGTYAGVWAVPNATGTRRQ